MSNNEMASKVKEYKELKSRIKQLQAELNGIEDEIKTEMLAQGTEEMTVDIFKVRWTPVQSKRIDTTALKESMPIIAAYYIKPTTTRRFSIA